MSKEVVITEGGTLHPIGQGYLHSCQLRNLDKYGRAAQQLRTLPGNNNNNKKDCPAKPLVRTKKDCIRKDYTCSILWTSQKEHFVWLQSLIPESNRYKRDSKSYLLQLHQEEPN